jgi:hypothetical protein
MEWQDNIHTSVFQCVSFTSFVSVARLLTLRSPLTDVLDGGMITLALWTLNIAHPGYLLKRHDIRVKTIPTSPPDVDILPSKEGSHPVV